MTMIPDGQAGGTGTQLRVPVAIAPADSYDGCYPGFDQGYQFQDPLRPGHIPIRFTVMVMQSFIGRDREISLIEQSFSAARTGRGSVVLLAGEAGVGKTRLAEAVLVESDLQLLRARARQYATPAYGPITTVLREALNLASGQEQSREAIDHGPLSPYLAMLLPELGPPPDDAEPEILVEAIIAALVSAARRQATVVLLEDLQWADNASLEIIPLLADRIVNEGLVVLATYRSDEITRGHPLRRLRNEMRRAQRPLEIIVEPLAPADTALLLERILGTTPGAALIDIVCQQTQGIPLYVEELASALLSSGRVQDTGQGMDLIPGEMMPIPESIRDAVLLQLDRLSEDARRQLEIAAVTGLDFDFELITGLAGTEEGIEELIGRNLMVETGAGRGAFRHALIREAIHGEISWSRRRSLNRRIATYLERAGAPPEQVVEHWLAANENEPARLALLDLAARSCRLHAYRDAARSANRALEIWPEGEDETQRLDALQQLARCAQVSGQLGDAVRALREVVDSLADSHEESRRAEAQRSLATIYGLQGAWEQALQARQEAAGIYEVAGEPAEAALEWLAVAGRYTANSALDHALESIRRAGSLAVEAERIDIVSRAKGFEGNVLAMLGEFETGRELAQEALTIALEANQTEAASEAYRRLASVLDYSSDFTGSRDAYATAVDYCHTQGDDVNAQVCLGCMSFIVYRTGEWKRALEVCKQVIGDDRSAVGSTAIAHGIMGLIRAYRGQMRGARKILQEALTHAREGQVKIMELACLFGQAVVAELEGDTDGATELHRQVINGWHETQDRHDLVPFFLWQATFFVRNDREPEVTRCADALATMASATGNPEAVAALAHALGEVALMAGNSPEAVRQFELALDQTEKLDIPLELAITTWRLGSSLAAGGDRETAIRHLTNAYRILRNLGARPVAALVADELHALGERMEEGRHPDTAARTVRGGLTRRQMEIARLIADGLTNKQIAAKLYLSPRTIDMHVSNILDRLDCRSRTEAARKAADLGLLD